MIGQPIDVQTTSDFEWAEISFTLSQELLNMIDINDLVIYWYDDENGVIIPQATKIDASTGKVSAVVTHFSRYFLSYYGVQYETMNIAFVIDSYYGDQASLDIYKTNITNTVLDLRKNVNVKIVFVDNNEENPKKIMHCYFMGVENPTTKENNEVIESINNVFNNIEPLENTFKPGIIEESSEALRKGREIIRNKDNAINIFGTKPKVYALHYTKGSVVFCDNNSIVLDMNDTIGLIIGEITAYYEDQPIAYDESNIQPLVKFLLRGDHSIIKVEKTGRKSWELKQGGENNENDVIVLQKALVNRGYLGRLTDDFGTFDTETKNAVMNYQVFNGISPIGIVDKNTWTQLALPWNDLNQEPNRDDFKNYLEILYDDNYDCEPPVIALTQPTDGDIMNTGDSVHIATSGTNCGYIQLFVNGELEETQASNSFEYNYRMNSQGDYSIQIKARNMLSPYKGEIAESEIVTVKVKHYYENITDIEVLPQGYHEFFVNELHSTVYVYITNPATEKITFSIGQPDKHETVSQIASASGLNPIVAMNAGFFDMTMNSVEHFGVLIVNGKELEPVSLKKQKKDDGSYEIVDVYKKRVEEANTFIKWENGTTEIKKITDVDIPYIKENAEWAIGAGYTLLDVKQGIKNNNKAIGNNWSSLYTEWKPRTMLGVKENGEFILAVIEGERDKTKNKKGANAKEEADVMEQLGAVMAINFDGGGSSTFWKEEEGNKFVGENKNGRKIGSIIMVVDK